MSSKTINKRIKFTELVTLALKLIPWMLFAVTSIGYICVFIPPEKFWPTVILTFGILPLIFLNLILFFILLIMKKKSLFWPLTALILGAFFIKLSISFQFGERTTENDSFSILSYNADFFHLKRDVSDPSVELINWIRDDSSSIKCIQEFISYKNKPEWNLNIQMKEKGYNEYKYYFDNSDEVQRGMAIFSRYPVINQGNILLNPDKKNNCIYVDIVVFEDTVRIYNLHLSSMSIPEIKNKYVVKYGGYLKNVVKKLKNGALKHSEEINLIINHTSECPYPFILCGDFNETPYSNNYLKLRKHFKNTFEEAGAGFGFSFNGRLFFLRIDHQFYSHKIRPLKFRVDHSIRKSGHFPTRGIYEILK